MNGEVRELLAYVLERVVHEILLEKNTNLSVKQQMILREKVERLKEILLHEGGSL